MIKFQPSASIIKSSLKKIHFRRHGYMIIIMAVIKILIPFFSIYKYSKPIEPQLTDIHTKKIQQIQNAEIIFFFSNSQS